MHISAQPSTSHESHTNAFVSWLRIFSVEAVAAWWKWAVEPCFRSSRLGLLSLRETEFQVPKRVAPLALGHYSSLVESWFTTLGENSTATADTEPQTSRNVTMQHRSVSNQKYQHFCRELLSLGVSKPGIHRFDSATHLVSLITPLTISASLIRAFTFSRFPPLRFRNTPVPLT